MSSYRRRVTSQRCSLEFLEDAVGCASVQRYTPYLPLVQGPELQLPLTPGATRRSKEGKNDLLFTLQNQACIWITKTQRPEENPFHQEHEAV